MFLMLSILSLRVYFLCPLWNAQDAQIESSKSNNVLITVDSGIHSYDM